MLVGNYNSLIQRINDILIKLSDSRLVRLIAIELYCTADLGEQTHQGFFGQRFGQRTIDFHILNDESTLNHSGLFGNAEISHGYERLFARKQVALLGQCLSSGLVTVEGSSHLLIVHPLVTHELQVIIALGSLQILVGGLDETGGQLVLLLQGGVSQRGVDGGLFQVGALLSVQGGIQVLA